METHGPCTLKGPFTQHREWWQRPARKPRKRAPERTGIRFELVQRVRRAIAAGTYDTPEKLAIALDTMMKRLELD